MRSARAARVVSCPAGMLLSVDDGAEVVPAVELSVVAGALVELFGAAVMLSDVAPVLEACEGVVLPAFVEVWPMSVLLCGIVDCVAAPALSVVLVVPGAVLLSVLLPLVCANDMPMAAHSAVTAAAMVTLLGSLFMDAISCVR